MLARLMHRREREYAARDERVVRSFEWGASFVTEMALGSDEREALRDHARQATANSEEFYAVGETPSDFKLLDDELTWTSAIHTGSPENNMARARFFPEQKKRTSPAQNGSRRRAVLVLPHWNAQPNDYLALCRFLNRLGIATLRLVLPYHENRRPPEINRADYLVSPNLGQTLQSMRQAVVDTRTAVGWLREHGGYDRIGILGTSVGSCTAFLAFAHDPTINVAVFNHVSGHVADVVWRGISTQHVREGLGNNVSLEELREYWMPISPASYRERLLSLPPRPMRLIAARYDLTFPADLSREVISEVRKLGINADVVWLPCGHYTSGELPWKYLDGWKIVSFFRQHL